MEKSNILMIGPSGSGKTHLVRSLASYLNVPLVIGDATSLTEAGYVGDDVESLLSRVLQAANGDLGVAQQGIVYNDEIDKIQRNGSGFKDLRQGVQHSRLKILEGKVATVPPHGGWKHPTQPGADTRCPSCRALGLSASFFRRRFAQIEGFWRRAVTISRAAPATAPMIPPTQASKKMGVDVVGVV